MVSARTTSTSGSTLVQAPSEPLRGLPMQGTRMGWRLMFALLAETVQRANATRTTVRRRCELASGRSTQVTNALRAGTVWIDDWAQTFDRFEGAAEVPAASAALTTSTSSPSCRG